MGPPVARGGCTVAASSPRVTRRGNRRQRLHAQRNRDAKGGSEGRRRSRVTPLPTNLRNL